MDKSFNVLEAAEYLDISVRELNELTKAGLINPEELMDEQRITYEGAELEKTKKTLYRLKQRI